MSLNIIPLDSASLAASSNPSPTTSTSSALPSSSSSTSTFTLGTRRSQLALVQTHLVASALSRSHPSSPSSSFAFPVESMSTVGDKNQTTPLHLLSPYSSSQPAKSLWTDELESALVDGRFDLLVHSCKDVPTLLREGCEIACLLEREDPRDALVVKEGLEYKSLDDLPEGSIVGTGSVRRVAQLRRAYPGLKFDDMRGNLNTRLSKLDNPSSPFAALILATSGLVRIDLGHRITSPLQYPVLLHAVGQGALAVEIRTGDAKSRDALRSIGHWQTEWRVAAERGLLRVLEGGCSVPVGVETSLVEIYADAAHGSNGSLEPESPFTTDSFTPLTSSSPTLHFSGLLAGGYPLPGETPVLRSRRAHLNLKACVTSTDGRKHVLYEAPTVLVSSWRESERWGEVCARELRKLGASEILEEIEKTRKEREEVTMRERLEALERAKAKGDESVMPQ